MKISKPKTKSMHVERPKALQLPSIESIKKVEATYKHECKFCGRRCKTSRGLKIHTAACNKWHGLSEETYTINRIDAVFGRPQDRWFRVEWENHPDQDSWEPERSLISQGCEEAT